MTLVTVFTPTYNRADFLKRCYESLKKQTSKKFTWLIVDDGSTDNTKEIVQQWIDEYKIKIKYIKKQNGGKVSAINESYKHTTTKLWMCLDSDDYLLKSAIENIVKSYRYIEDDTNLCGFLALRTGPDGEVMGHQKRIPQKVKRTTLKKIRYDLGIETEYVMIYKTDIINKYPYPIIEGEKFFPLSYIYNKLDMKYTYYILQEDLMISEYYDDGITKNKKNLIKKNPIGYTIHNANILKYEKSWKRKVKATILYNVGCILSKNRAQRYVDQVPSKWLTTLFYPISFLIVKMQFS